jgi:glyoxylase-like metal-dependent hydrolase (beta-lactamase superfamily II)
MFRLLAITLATLLVSLSSPAQAQVRTAFPAERGLGIADFPRLVPLGGGVYAYEALRAPGFTTVSLIVVGSDGVLIADGQESPDATSALLAAVATVTQKPVRWMVVGSVHEDHTGGTEALPANTVLIVHPDGLSQIKSGGRKVETGPRAIGEIKSIDLGGRAVDILFLGRAHTASDLVVRVPDQNLIFMSEVFMNRVFPPMRSAFPQEWEDSLQRALDLKAYRYIPGHGFVDGPERSREEMQAFRKAITHIRSEARRLQGSSLGEGTADWGEYATWMLADSQGPIALQRLSSLSE